jgi:hypothetical protein
LNLVKTVILSVLKVINAVQMANGLAVLATERIFHVEGIIFRKALARNVHAAIVKVSQSAKRGLPRAAMTEAGLVRLTKEELYMTVERAKSQILPVSFVKRVSFPRSLAVTGATFYIV